MNEFDFSRQRRLLNAGDFRRVFDQADFKISDQHLLILARPSLDENSRLGLVIAKKGIKLAVHRNRVKRVMRDSFRTLCTHANEFSPLWTLLYCPEVAWVNSIMPHFTA